MRKDVNVHACNVIQNYVGGVCGMSVKLSSVSIIPISPIWCVSAHCAHGKTDGSNRNCSHIAICHRYEYDVASTPASRYHLFLDLCIRKRFQFEYRVLAPVVYTVHCTIYNGLKSENIVIKNMIQNQYSE